MRAFRDAIELLDWYHLVEQLRFGIGHPHGPVLEWAINAALPGDVEALLALLAAHARRLEGDDPEQATRCRAVIGYVEHNRRGIANYRIVPMASSGPMEKGVDLVVARRFKRRGMRLAAPRGQPPAAPAPLAAQRHLGPLLDRADVCLHATVAGSGVISTENGMLPTPAGTDGADDSTVALR